MEQIDQVALTDDQYTVMKTSVRNKYEATDSDGKSILRGNHEMFEMQDEFNITDANEDDVYNVEASEAIDIAGTYLLTDTQTGEEIALLDNDFSLLQDTWRIRDPADQSVLAELNSRGAPFALARKVLPVGGLIKRAYEISDETGSHIGSITEKHSVRTQYEITIEDASTVPKAAIVVGAMVIDGIQG